MSRRPGRPPLDPAGAAAVRLSISVAPRTYDALTTRAADARVSLSEFVRQQLRDASRGGTGNVPVVPRPSPNRPP